MNDDLKGIPNLEDARAEYFAELTSDLFEHALYLYDMTTNIVFLRVLGNDEQDCMLAGLAHDIEHPEFTGFSFEHETLDCTAYEEIKA